MYTHTQFTIQRETLYILHEPPDLEPDTALPGQGGKEGEMGEGRLQGGERPRNQLGWGRRVKSSLTLCSLTCCMAEDSPCLVHFMAVDKLSRASHDSFLELSWLIVRNSDFVWGAKLFLENQTSFAWSSWKCLVAHLNCKTVGETNTFMLQCKPTLTLLSDRKIFNTRIRSD